MSVINQMLRDLEKQRQQKKNSSANNETPVAVVKSNPIKGLIIGIVVLLVIGWMGFKFIPPMITSPTVDQLAVAPSVVPPPVLVDDKVSPIIVAPIFEQVSDTNSGTNLLTLNVVENNNIASLHLLFAQLPEYRLLPNSTGVTQVVVDFKHTRVDANFEIPIVGGNVVKRISLVPQKETLTLLVDIVKQAQIDSLQLTETDNHQYQLTIDVKLLDPIVVVPLDVKPVSSEPLPVVAVAPQKQLAVLVVDKSVKLVSPDQQAFEQGLKQFKLVDYVAAQKSFRRALDLNPSLLDARLHLVQLLKQQHQLDQVRQLLQQGLELHPVNYKLRKELARLYLQQQQYLVAIELLSTEPVPAVAQDLEYFALLAALQQEAGQFSATVLTYSYLLQVRPNEALWWFGLALAQDQDGNYEQARKAYLQAAALPGLKNKLREYSNNRLQQL